MLVVSRGDEELLAARRPPRAALPRGRGRQLGRPPSRRTAARRSPRSRRCARRAASSCCFPQHGPLVARPLRGTSASTSSAATPTVVRDEERVRHLRAQRAAARERRRAARSSSRCTTGPALTRQCLDAILGEPPARAVRDRRRRRCLDRRHAGAAGGYGEPVRAVAPRRERRLRAPPATTARRRRAASCSCSSTTTRSRGAAGSTRWSSTPTRIPRRRWSAASCCSRTTPIQHAGVVVCQDGNPRHLYAGFPADHPAVNKSRAASRP